MRLPKWQRKLLKRASRIHKQVFWGPAVTTNGALRFTTRLRDSHHRWSAFGAQARLEGAYDLTNPVRAITLYLKKKSV